MINLQIGKYIPRFQYTSAPEGQDIAGKVLGLSKYGFATGTSIAAYEILLLAENATVLQGLNCIAFWALPLTGMSVTFATATYLATRKFGDRKLSYALGALATTPIVYAWCRKPVHTYHYAVLATLFAVGFKYMQQDQPFNPKKEWPTWDLDYSLVKDPRDRMKTN